MMIVLMAALMIGSAGMFIIGRVTIIIMIMIRVSGFDMAVMNGGRFLIVVMILIGGRGPTDRPQ